MLVIADASGTVLDVFEPPDGMEGWPEDGTNDYRRVVTANLPDGVGFDDVQVVRTDDRSLARYHLTVENGEIVAGEQRTPPEPEPQPDVGGLKLAAFDQLGRGEARQLVRDYPDLLDALNDRNWSMARQAVDDAHTDGAITDDQRQTVVDLMAAHHIPEE